MIRRWPATQKEQAGSASLQFLCYALSAWVILVVLLRLTPIYLEHRAVLSILENVVADYDASEDTTARIKQKLRTGWAVNGVDQVGFDTVRIKRRRSALTLSVHYDVEFPIVSSINGVWSFDATLTTP